MELKAQAPVPGGDLERKWVSRTYQPGDEAGIVALWRIAFPNNDEVGRAEVDYWNWQYRQPPAGTARIRLAVAGDQIVGHYAVIPVAMQIHGRHLLGTLSLDTMTHPDFYRQGILTTLANQVYDELSRDGLPVTCGFPNENSVGALVNKLEWDYICALPIYVKPLRPGAIVDAVLKNRALATLARPLAHLGAGLLSRPATLPAQAHDNIRWPDRFDERADALWQAKYDPATHATTRSAEYLNWRYPDNPLRDYRILAYEEQGQLVAYAVLRCMAQFGMRGGMITELIGLPGREDAVQAVMAAAEAHLAEQGMDLVACLMFGDKGTLRLLRRAGFLPAPRRMLKEWHYCVRVNNGSVDRMSVIDPGRWYVTFGDTDII